MQQKYSIWDSLNYILTLLFVAIDTAVLYNLLNNHPLQQWVLTIAGLLLMVTQAVLFIRRRK